MQGPPSLMAGRAYAPTRRSCGTNAFQAASRRLGPWLAFMSGVANRITAAAHVGEALRDCVPEAGASRTAGAGYGGCTPGAREATMAGKNRKGGSSGSQQTGQGNQQGGQNKGKGSGSKGSR